VVRHSGRGFVLVLVLWLLLAGTVSVGLLASWIESALEQARIGVLERHYLADRLSTRATLMYLLVTQPMTVAGLTTDSSAGIPRDEDGNFSIRTNGSELRLDGRVYPGVGSSNFSLQDLRGLLNLNYSRDDPLAQHIAGRGASLARAKALVSKLRDYTDQDSLYRLNGAEAPQYEESNLPGPANRLLRSPLEVRNVLGWQASELPLSDGDILGAFWAGPDTQMNLNTAPMNVLQSLGLVSPTDLPRIASLRRVAAFDSRDKLAAVMPGITAEDLDPFVLFPSRYLSLSIWPTTKKHARDLFALKLTPFADEGPRPWAVLERYAVVVEEPDDQDAVEIFRLPPAAQALFD
jgi:type II secretory pathway component PulK